MNLSPLRENWEEAVGIGAIGLAALCMSGDWKIAALTASTAACGKPIGEALAHMVADHDEKKAVQPSAPAP